MEMESEIKFEELQSKSDIVDNDEIELPEDEEFFSNAKKYWADVEANLNGMLGGYEKISNNDIRSSISFIQTIFKIKPTPGKKYALDCGAGIGRVTKNLLLPIFDKVDIVEQDKHFCDQAKIYIGNQNFGIIYNIGLQDFTPELNKYDVIWSQWVLGHLKDNHLVDFLKRCSNGLTKNGIIVIKENFTNTNEMDLDTTDSSVTRPLERMKEIIQLAGLRIIKEQKASNFPKGLYPVFTIALRKNKNNLMLS